MEKSRRGGWKLLHSRVNPAVTWFDSVSLAPGLRLYLLRPYTGRTHQLRVALKSLGAPILGDALYGPAQHDSDRGYLHAALLSFALDGQRWTYTCLPSHGQWFTAPDSQAQMAALLAAGRARLEVEMPTGSTLD
jgi:tRNA pseudouridine32 synthase/23S rRNA pseudouridine746 synthase